MPRSYMSLFFTILIERVLQFLSDFFYNQYLRWTKWQADRKLGAARSPLWSKTKKEYETLCPKICSICETEKNCELHHCLPFHTRPDLENSFSNLLWLCRIHHFWFGHLGKWASFEKDIRAIAKEWNAKIKNRP